GPHCHTTTCAELPPEVAGATCGPRLQATVALLTGAGRLSKRAASWVCQQLRGVPRSPAQVCGVEQPVALALAGAGAAAREDAAGEPANRDETSWREGKTKGWLWTAVTAAVPVFLIRRSRGAGPLREVRDAGQEPVVPSDRCTPSAVLPRGRRPVCGAQRRCDFQAMLDRGGRPAQGARTWWGSRQTCSASGRRGVTGRGRRSAYPKQRCV